MTLSIKPTPYLIPPYSLTGDLLSYLKCGLQYRYQNKGSLPPSKPVQLWFGEFIHGVMEEAFVRWSQGSAPPNFPWSWQPTIREIELVIAQRLMARGLYPPPNVFDRKPTSNFLIASQRAEAAINTWGPHLFPLIAEPEVKLKGIRQMLATPSPRATYYEIQGIVDVLGAVQLTNAPRANLILHYLQNDSGIKAAITTASSKPITNSTYEIIVDYKGTRRPAVTSDDWQRYEWQVLTYSWLRAQQPNSAPVIAGILLFINELIPSDENLEDLQKEIKTNRTDVMPAGPDLKAITSWNGGKLALSRPFLEQRSIRIIQVGSTPVNTSLSNFDKVVRDIETSVAHETGGRGIKASWQATPELRTCTACDFKTYCDVSLQAGPPAAP